MSFLISLFNSVFTYPLFNLLMALYYLLGDFGLAIVVLTCLVSLLLLPLTLRQLRLAKINRRLQPQIAELRRQHAGNRQAQTEALQALYQEHGIRPASSFLSIVLQVPIYSGLYFALNTVLHTSSVQAINRIMYPFLFHFTTLPNIDLMWLTVFNAVWHISLGVPDPTHLLPLLTGLLTFVQVRMAQSLEVREGAMQLSQGAQFLLLLLPVGLTVFFAWQFAAGIALYRCVSLLLNMLQQCFVAGWGSLWALPLARNDGGVVLSENQRMLPRRSSKTSSSRRGGSSRRRGRKARRGK